MGVESLWPTLARQWGEPPARRGGPADVVDKNVESIEPLENSTDDSLDTVGRADVRLDEQVGSLRSEEHTSELQSPDHLVCRLLLEKKKNTRTFANSINSRYAIILTTP